MKNKNKNSNEAIIIKDGSGVSMNVSIYFFYFRANRPVYPAVWGVLPLVSAESKATKVFGCVFIHTRCQRKSVAILPTKKIKYMWFVCIFSVDILKHSIWKIKKNGMEWNGSVSWVNKIK